VEPRLGRIEVMGGVALERVFIIGAGVVGKATGIGFVQMGHRVTLIDVQPERVEALRADGLDARIGLDLTGEPASYLFLTLPTPNAGRRYDLSAFEQGVRDVGRALARSTAMHTVVVRSTVPPGTTEDFVKPLLEEESGTREGVGFCLASNPEFLRAASAADDFRWPWMTVIGARSKRVQERLAALLSPFGGELRVFADPTTAEMIKCAHNIFNATKISFWNEMWRVCQDLGVNHDDVAGTVARSAEGSYNIHYGIRGGAPYGGVCLPKDTNGFLGFAAGRGIRMPLLESVVRVNEEMAELVQRELSALEADASPAPADGHRSAPVPQQRVPADLPRGSAPAGR
jgi:UDPglucose 6-dehydrogenase